jgi:PTS system mannose-specific IID component
MNTKIKLREFIKIIFHSFFIQTVWNYQSYLSIGFSFALQPVAQKLFKKKAEIINFLTRHLDFFNAHPYFSSFAIGAIARLEEEQAARDKKEYKDIQSLKNALIGPLGAIGDQLFWANIKPACLLFGTLGVLIVDNLVIKITVLISALLLYNIQHLLVRTLGLIKGYQMGYNVYKILNLENYRVPKKLFSLLGAFSLGIIVGWALIDSGKADPFHILIFLMSAFSAYLFWKWKQNIYGSMVIALLLTIVFSIIIAHI